MERPRISFVMPVYRNVKTVTKAVKSILDQDFKDLEVILVDDGSTDGSREKIENLVKRQRVRALYFDKNQGACIARNEGAKLSEADYVAFLPADAWMLPGMVRLWVEYLDENPDYIGLYGGYRWKEREEPYMSEPFNPYTLEGHNYIDGSFPLRRKAFWEAGGWDPSVKSLQDWDLALAMVKKGGKYLYVPDIFFETEWPKAGGLSDDSGRNWIERFNQIRDKHGIPRRKIAVYSYGAALHGINVAKMLGADFFGAPYLKPNEYEMHYLIGYFSMRDRGYEWNVQTFRNPSAVNLVHWIGSDLLVLAQGMSRIDHRKVENILKGANVTNLTEFQQTYDELKGCGIDSKIVPFPANPIKSSPLPDKFTVAVYAPKINREFYNITRLEAVAEEMDDINWIFFGNEDEVNRPSPKNITYAGFVTDMQSLVDKSSCLLRLPQHDGLPVTLLEFGMGGRHLIWNNSFEYVHHYDSNNVEELLRLIRSLKKKKVDDRQVGYYQTLASPERFVQTIQELLEYKPQEFWNRYAPNYLSGLEPEVEFSEKIKSLVPKPGSVLDVGCGNGRAKKMFEDYQGFDFSADLIAEAKKIYPGTSFTVSSILDYQPEKKFDTVFVHRVLQHVLPKDIEKTIKKIESFGLRVVIIEPVEFSSKRHSIAHDYDTLLPGYKKTTIHEKMMLGGGSWAKVVAFIKE